jgi:hypothetical protein
MSGYENKLGAPTVETVIHLTIRATSLAELRQELQKALDGMDRVTERQGVALPTSAGTELAPAAPTLPEGEVYEPLPESLVEQVKQRREALAEEKPRRTRKAKEEAPAAPAVDPTSTSTPPAPAVAPSADTAPSTAPGPQSDATAEKASSSTPAAPSSGLTHEGVKKSAEQWMSEHPDGPVQGKKEIRSYLASFGVSRVAELPAESLQDFLDVLEGA